MKTLKPSRKKKRNKPTKKTPKHRNALSLVYCTGKISGNELIKKTETKSSESPISINDKTI